MNILLLREVVAVLLAGGAGERLYPLTRDRVKPAVYFGGPHRIIDFTLSNCINSGLPPSQVMRHFQHEIMLLKRSGHAIPQLAVVEDVQERNAHHVETVGQLRG